LIRERRRHNRNLQGTPDVGFVMMFSGGRFRVSPDSCRFENPHSATGLPMIRYRCNVIALL
jgi:hypothetical protein